MKVNQFGAARQAIQSFVGQTSQQSVQQNAPVAQSSAVQKLESAQKIAQLMQTVAQQPDPLIDMPPVMRYGVLPPPPEDPAIVMRYGVMPPPEDVDDPPIMMRYGIMPPPEPDPAPVMRYGIIPPPSTLNDD